MCNSIVISEFDNDPFIKIELFALNSKQWIMLGCRTTICAF